MTIHNLLRINQPLILLLMFIRRTEYSVFIPISKNRGSRHQDPILIQIRTTHVIMMMVIRVQLCLNSHN
ncbi:hypothetical protein Hanom_Chr12g01099891 [Helianthus anomalus]